MPQQRRLDLAGLDAEAADLHLRIGAPEEVQDPVRAPARQVAGAVHPAPGRPERIGDEALRRQPGAPEIAPRQPRSRDVELARNPGRHRLQASIQHVNLRVPDRTADRHRSVIRITGLNFIGRAAARRFRWPVVNDELGLRNMPAPGSNVRAAHALATDHDAMGQSCKAFNGRRVVQNVEVRGSKLEQTEIARGSVVVCQDLELFFFGRKHDELAREQGQEKCGDRRIERQCIENWCSNSNVHSAGWNSPCDVVGNRGVIDHHAFWCARGT